LRDGYPAYFISKNKVELPPDANIDALLEKMKQHYSSQRITDSDGVRIDFDSERKWVHLRKSNTEPVIRIYAEALGEASAATLAKEVLHVIATTRNEPEAIQKRNIKTNHDTGRSSLYYGK
jgi:phosphomannomutase